MLLYARLHLDPALGAESSPWGDSSVARCTTRALSAQLIGKWCFQVSWPLPISLDPRAVCAAQCALPFASARGIRRDVCDICRDSGRTEALYTAGGTPTNRLNARSNVRTSRKPDANATRGIEASPISISLLARVTRSKRSHSLKEIPTFERK